jgi:hypothetical protein
MAFANMQPCVYFDELLIPLEAAKAGFCAFTTKTTKIDKKLRKTDERRRKPAMRTKCGA